jgi:predicted Rossmann fold flavoprotein
MAQAQEHKVYDLLVVGAGAAGFFGAIRAAEECPSLRVALLESGSEVLSKVKISGGGRCNVTHHLFDPKRFAERYPRGEKELLGVFHRFQARDTVRWFEERGLRLKTEKDGRMFPESNDSSSVVHLFLDLCKKHSIEIKTNTSVKSLRREDHLFHLETSKGEMTARSILWATGGQRGAWKILEKLGHTIVEPVPSLFSFKLDPHLWSGLEGSALPNARVQIQFGDSESIQAEGPVLVTHWGLSGPAILRLSAWGARAFAKCNYRAELLVAADATRGPAEWEKLFRSRREQSPKKKIDQDHPAEVPSRLWQKYCESAQIPADRVWAELRKTESSQLLSQLVALRLQISGRGIFKDEFVTAGGVELKEVCFRTMQSRLVQGLYFAGEVLNVDGITGGFNFQNAWSTSWIAGGAIAESLSPEISLLRAAFYSKL